MTTTITAHSPTVPMESVTSTRPAARNLITFPVICIYLWTFIHIGRPQDVFEILQAIRPGNIAAGLSISSFILWGEKDKRVFSFPETKLFLVFFFISALSVPYSYNKTISTDFIVDFFGKVGLYLYITSKLITTERRIDGMIKMLTLSGFMMAIATVLTQEAGVRAAVGSTYDPNDMALLMVVTIPLAVTQGLGATNRPWKILSYACVAFCLLALLATGSRGGFLGLLAIGFFILKANMPGLPKRKIIVLAVVFGAFFMFKMGDDFAERMSTITEDVSSDRAGSGRILIWKRSLVLAKDHLFFGVGPHCFDSAYGKYVGEGLFTGPLAPVPGEWAAYRWAVAHSAYLTILVELGILGAFNYLLFIMFTLKTFNECNRSAAKNETLKHLAFIASGLKISFIGFLICVIFLSQAYAVTFFLLCFLSYSLKRLMQKT